MPLAQPQPDPRQLKPDADAIGGRSAGSGKAPGDAPGSAHHKTDRIAQAPSDKELRSEVEGRDRAAEPDLGDASEADGADESAAVPALDVEEPEPVVVSAAVRQDVPEWALPVAADLGRRSKHVLLRQASSGDGLGQLQAVNNALMDLFRLEQEHPFGIEAYTLLYELNLQPFAAIAGRIMRMTGSRADVGDVLQEAFLAIYRYPSKFCPDKPNAFRNWSYSIIRNTVYRCLQSGNRDPAPTDFVFEILADDRVAPPDRDAELAESELSCRRVYGLLLCLYAQIYETELKPRDREALQLVEVQGLGYRDAAGILDVRLENFKMIVCRARKRIVQAMLRVLGTRQS